MRNVLVFINASKWISTTTTGVLYYVITWIVNNGQTCGVSLEVQSKEIGNVQPTDAPMKLLLSHDPIERCLINKLS
jgi:hypothetical protein